MNKLKPKLSFHQQKKLDNSFVQKKKFDYAYITIDKHITYSNRRVNINKVSLMRIIEEANQKWGLDIPLEGSKLTVVESK